MEIDRFIICLNLDCYEVQVWLKELKPDLIGKDVPIAVVNRDQRILSVNYTAKSLGVESGDRESLHDAHSKCQRVGKKLIEIKVGELRFGEEDTFIPQVESDKILRVIQNFQANLGENSSSIIIERSSRDEFYIDITTFLVRNFISIVTIERPNPTIFEKLTDTTKQSPNAKYYGKHTTIMETLECEPLVGPAIHRKVRVSGIKSNQDVEELLLIHGAIIAQNLMEFIKKEIGYEASAGIAHSKLMAKLACSRNKPEGITIIANSSHQRLQKEIYFQDLPGFGSDIGSKIKVYGEKKCKRKINTIEDILSASGGCGISGYEFVFKELRIPDAVNRAKEFYEFCHFLDEAPVMPVVHQKTFSTSMTFKGNRSWEEFNEKIWNLSRDMDERITYNINEGRIPHEVVVKATMLPDANANVPREREDVLKLGRGQLQEKIYRHIQVYLQYQFDSKNMNEE